MCSVDPSTDLIVEEQLDLTDAPCRKCSSQESGVVLQKKFPYCRECFLIYFKHKYSGGLGKAKVVRSGDKVLLSFSGSLSSISLLNLVHTNLNEEKKKKTKFEVVLVFIEDLFERSTEEKIANFKAISELVANYGYKLFFSCLSDDNEVILSDEPQQIVNEKCENMTSVYGGFTSETAKSDFIARVRLQILYKVAKKLDCTKIFTAETSDHIATRIISNISIGRGKTLAADAGYVSYLNDEIPLIRPLRECSKEEVTYYKEFTKLPSLSMPKKKTEGNKFSSIQKLTDSFVSDLLEKFPSTVSTIISTGSKLSQNPTGKKCLLCQSHMDEERELTAKEAMRLSQQVTIHGPDKFACSTFSQVEDGKANALVHADEVLSLCYSCTILFRESKKKSELLRLFASQVEEANGQRVYNEIKEFLF